jgi:hypothetical protein
MYAIVSVNVPSHEFGVDVKMSVELPKASILAGQLNEDCWRDS